MSVPNKSKSRLVEQMSARLREESHRLTSLIYLGPRMIVVEYAISFIKSWIFHRSREGFDANRVRPARKRERWKEEKRCILEKRKKKKNAKVERGAGEMVKRNE